MGKIIGPMCSCKHRFRMLYLGGGMMGHVRICNVPYACGNCGDIIAENILEHNHKCENCNNPIEMMGELIFTCDNNIKETIPRRYVFDWQLDSDKTYVLEDKLYVCPNCKTQNLKFKVMGSWD